MAGLVNKRRGNRERAGERLPRVAAGERLPPISTDGRVLRVSAAARLVGVSVTTLRRWSDDGRLACARSAGGHRLYKRSDLERLRRQAQRTSEMVAGRRRARGTSTRRATSRRQAERPAERSAVVDEVGCGFFSMLDPGDLLGSLTDHLAETFDVPGCFVYLCRGAHALECVAQGGHGWPTDEVGATYDAATWTVTLRALRERRPVVVETTADPHVEPESRRWLETHGVKSHVVVPLLARDKVIGTVELLETRRRRRFAPEEVATLEAACRVAGLALDNAGLFEQTRRKNEMLGQLVELSRLVTTLTDVDELLRAAARRLLTSVDAACCDVFRFAGDDDLVCLVSVERDGCDDDVVGKHLNLGKYRTSRTAVAERRILVVRDRHDPGLSEGDLEVFDKYGFESELCVPLVLGERLVGLIEFYDERPRDYAEALDFVRSAARLLAGAFDKAVLMQRLEASNDELRRLVDAGLEFSESLDIDDVLLSVATTMRSVAEAARCDIYAVEDGTAVGLVSVSDDDDDPAFPETAYPLENLSFARRMDDTLGPVLIEDVEAAEALTEAERAEWATYGLRSGLSLPLLAGGRLIGAAVVFDAVPRRFEHLELLRGLSQIASQAIFNARLYRERDAGARRMALLNEIGVEFSSSHSSRRILETLVARLRDVIDATESSVYLLAPNGTLRCAAKVVEGKAQPEEVGREYPLQAWPISRLVITSQAAAVVETLADPRIDPPGRAWLEEHGVKSYLVAPLATSAGVLGTVELVERRQERRFTPEDLTAVETVCRLAAMAIENARLLESLEERNAELDETGQRLALVNDSAVELSSTLDLKDVLFSTALRLCSAIDVPDCDIYTIADDGAVECVASVVDGASDETWQGRAFLFPDLASIAIVSEERRPVVMDDDDARLTDIDRVAMKEYGEKSMLAVPLVAKDRVIGAVELCERRSRRRFTDVEIGLVQSICRVAALAIDNAGLFEALGLQARETELLNEIARRTAASLNVAEIAEGALDELRRLAPFDHASVVLMDEDGVLHAAYTSGGPGGSLEGVAPHESAPDFMERLAAERMLFLSLPDDNPLAPHHPAVEGLRSAAVIGLFDGDRVVGALTLGSATANAFSHRHDRLLKGVGTHLSLAVKNTRLFDEIKHLHLSNLKGLSSALNAKDYYTLGHASRVSAYAILLGHELGWTPDFLEQVEEAAYLHDIGKIGISDRVLQKQGPLNAEEWALMHRHPSISADIIGPLFDEELVLGVRHHHERYDGGGYPDGLAGEAIPLLARAMCVVDSYDAMSLARPYRQALSYTECLAELQRCRGTQFDPDMVDAFVRVLARLKERRDEALRVAAEAAARIDVAKHNLLREPADQERPEYHEIEAVLREVRDTNPPTRFITTQARIGKKYLVIVDGEAEGPTKSPLGEEFYADDQLRRVLGGEIPDSNVLVADEYGVWVSAAAPIRDGAGAVVAAVAADVPALETAALPGKIGHPAPSLLEKAAARLSRAEIDAVTDGLTGLYNHRYLHDRFAEELKRAGAEGTSLSVLFCDLDHFKEYNDRLGHRSGDRALRGVARIIEKCVRRSDLVARYGGEEFVVVTDTGADEALAVAERIRQETAAAVFEPGEEGLTISIGIACFPENGLTKEALLDKADWSMYRAKRQGRNRVVPFSAADTPSMGGRHESTERSYLSLIAEVVDAKDRFAEKRSEAVTRLAGEIAAELGLDEDAAREVTDAAWLCDIGELGVPERIINKDGALSDLEWELIREHPTVGRQMLHSLGGSAAVAEAVAHHHERFDGSGYPDGLAGDAIPLASRIIAAASAYHAMLIRRAYRPRRSERQALAELRRCAGDQFDPRVVAALERIVSAET